MILITIKLKQLILQEAKKVLLEYTMEQAKARFDTKSFRKRAKIEGVEPDVAEQNILKQVQQDISEQSKGDALWWVISTFINTGKFGEESGKKALETFFQIKEAGKGSILSQRDINQIQSWDELEQVVEQAKPDWDEYEKDKASKDAAAGTNKIYEDDNWEVFIPENPAAACKLGKGTKWCTAAPGVGKEFHNKYHKPEEGDPLIIFINKQDPTDKYQFSYGSDQFMDSSKPNARSIKEKPLFYKLNQIVKSLSDKLPEQVIKKADQWDYEELPDGGYKITKPDLIEWFNENGEFHRLDGPAREWPDGTERWYQMGKLHRLDGPAIEWSDGSKEWWIEGKRYGTEDAFNQTVKKLPDGGYKISAPNQVKYYNEAGQLHRLDGPAIEWSNGIKLWYIEGKGYFEQEFNQHPKIKELKAQQNLREHFMRFM